MQLMQSPPDPRHQEDLLRPTLALIAIGAGVLALEWHHAHARLPERCGNLKSQHRARPFSSASTPAPD